VASAVVDHKRLSHLPQGGQLLQTERDNRRASGSPSRTNQDAAPAEGSQARWNTR